ncbi:forkhead box protein N2 isoform X2 [Petaurus breviceps papuanus]|uniref:forkhead box protein N2 isoform X2 n=1 Tax=Petaurus breviceps papuanus TaxID=3040969 RepID=UPI0036DB3BF9
MGPVTGMTPDKRAETPGAEKVAGLSQIYRMGSLPEAVDAARPKATLVDSESADDELTNLNWLHESTNLLTNFSLGNEGLPIVSPIYDIEGDNVPSFVPSYQNTEKKSGNSKPPYSFSLLIYMAIEHSPNKCLPVKEIYSWILERFPYFATAPTGWKNSVRHNLSLNKCFQKVERSHGKVNGKGSLWCVDPEYKPNLIQALKKQPFSSALAFYTPPASPQNGSSPSHYITSVLKQSQVRTLKGVHSFFSATFIEKARKAKPIMYSQANFHIDQGKKKCLSSHSESITSLSLEMDSMWLLCSSEFLSLSCDLTLQYCYCYTHCSDSTHFILYQFIQIFPGFSKTVTFISYSTIVLHHIHLR